MIQCNNLVVQYNNLVAQYNNLMVQYNNLMAQYNNLVTQYVCKQKKSCIRLIIAHFTKMKHPRALTGSISMLALVNVIFVHQYKFPLKFTPLFHIKLQPLQFDLLDARMRFSQYFA